MNKVSHGVTEVYGFKKIQLKSYLIFIVDITFIILDVKLYVSSIPVYCSAAVCIHGDIPLRTASAVFMTGSKVIMNVTLS